MGFGAGKAKHKVAGNPAGAQFPERLYKRLCRRKIRKRSQRDGQNRAVAGNAEPPKRLDPLPVFAHGVYLHRRGLGFEKQGGQKCVCRGAFRGVIAKRSTRGLFRGRRAFGAQRTDDGRNFRLRSPAAKKQRHGFFAVRREVHGNSRRKADVGNPRTVVFRKIRVRKRKHAFGAREDFVSGQRAGVGDVFQNPAAAIKRRFPLPRAAGKQHVVFFCA